MSEKKWTGTELCQAISQLEEAGNIVLTNEQHALLKFLRAWAVTVLVDTSQETEIPYQEEDIKVFLSALRPETVRDFLKEASITEFHFREQELAESFQVSSAPEKARDELAQALVLASLLLFEKIEQVLN